MINCGTLQSTCISLIAECDGSGEPNIEPQVRNHKHFKKIYFYVCLPVLHMILNLSMNSLTQFMEWVDEGTKCPYCEGLGYTVCDLCGGKTMV